MIRISNICAMTSICSTIGAIGCLMIEKPLAFMILFFGAMITLTIAILTEER